MAKQPSIFLLKRLGVNFLGALGRAEVELLFAARGSRFG
jgi:hypothetical protein